MSLSTYEGSPCGVCVPVKQCRDTCMHECAFCLRMHSSASLSCCESSGIVTLLHLVKICLIMIFMSVCVCVVSLKRVPGLN